MLMSGSAAHQVSTYTSKHTTHLSEMITQYLVDLLPRFKSVCAVHELRLWSTQTHMKHAGFWLLQPLALFFDRSNVVLEKIKHRCNRPSTKVRRMRTTSTLSPE